MTERATDRTPLRCALDATSYQRDWFRDLQRRVASGEPLVLVNADAPQEIFRAMDVPYVVNQWWASVVAAKQRAGEYLELLRARGYPTDVDPYSAVALGSLFDTDAARAPWGGLPRPTFVVAELQGEATRGIFEAWALESGATFFAFEKTVSAVDLDAPWWDLMAADWERLVGADRIDLMTAELVELVALLERTTGRRLDEARLVRVLDLINEQEGWFRRTRDLIARSVPAPVDVADVIPATMIPQWHRGTEWARDMAKRLHDEVAERVAQGVAACDDERIRLMWVGRGIWSDLSFYRELRDDHGAVFVWSMYLGMAADGYVRAYDPAAPLRSVAGRFAAFAEQLHMPGWASTWHVKEALGHRVDGAVQIGEGGMFSTHALERAGIPVLRLAGNNVDPGAWDRDAVRAALADFIETRVAPVAARRRARR